MIPEKRLRMAAALVVLGLFIELVSLFWHHPLSFILFFVVGGLAISAGLLFFFWILLTAPRTPKGA